MLLGKVLRRIQRKRLKNNETEEDIDQNGVTSILRLAAHYALDNIQPEYAMDAFCECFLSLYESLKRGYFENIEEEGGDNIVGTKRKNAMKCPSFSLSPSESWLDDGLVQLVGVPQFLSLLFETLSSRVAAHAVTVSTPFGDARIPTDNSIDEALHGLPSGYVCLFQRIQCNLWKDTAMALFFYSIENSLGGPGCASRLAIDLLESQISSAEAVEEKRIEYQLHFPGGSEGALGGVLVHEIVPLLGPYPVNVAYGPILRHVFFIEALSQSYNQLELFISHCRNVEIGLRGDAIHRMGLLTVIGTFIFNETPTKLCDRRNNIFCRSQISNEFVWKVIPLSLLRELFQVVTEDEEYDDFVLISLSMGSHLISKHGSDVLSATCVQKIVNVLLENEMDHRQLLDDACFEKLITACNLLLNERT